MAVLFSGVLFVGTSYVSAAETAGSGGEGSHSFKIGVRNLIHFDGINVTDDKWTCPCDPEIKNADNHTFSIQQNFFLKLCNGTVFWVQGGYDVCYNGTPCKDLQVYVRQWYEIWVMNLTEPVQRWVDDITDTPWDMCDITGVQFFGNCTNVGKPSNFTLELNTYIKGNKLMMSGLQATPDQKVLNWTASVTGKIVDNPADSDIRNMKSNRYGPPTNTRPELVMVGLQGGSKAIWGNCTSGWVEDYEAYHLDATGKPKWIRDNAADIINNTNQQTGEESHNLDWDWSSGQKRGTFRYNPCSNETGIASYCVRRHLDAEPPELIDLTKPVSTQWHELYPNFSRRYKIISWQDNCDDKLSPSDYIELKDKETGKVEWYHVDAVTVTLNVTLKPENVTWMMIEFEGDIQDFPFENPVCTHWQEVYPNYSRSYHLQDWYDTGGGGKLTECDQIKLNQTCTNEKHEYHVEAVKTDIIVTKITAPWDINRDGTVNIKDIIIVALAFGSVPSDPNWNPDADIYKCIQPNRVCIFDLVMVAIHFGETYA